MQLAMNIVDQLGDETQAFHNGKDRIAVTLMKCVHRLSWGRDQRAVSWQIAKDNGNGPTRQCGAASGQWACSCGCIPG